MAFSCLLFLAFLTGVWFLGYLKREFARESKLPVRVVWTIGVYAVFFVEAFWMGLAIQNFFVPFLLPLGLVVIWTLVSLTYFVSVSFFTRIEMRQFLRSWIRDRTGYGKVCMHWFASLKRLLGLLGTAVALLFWPLFVWVGPDVSTLFADSVIPRLIS